VGHHPVVIYIDSAQADKNHQRLKSKNLPGRNSPLKRGEQHLRADRDRGNAANEK
jgi:hypothetical protein